ncbi:MAG: hypothetical protein HKN47_26725 [Pirellulaceae bacterium]|nr:hypothetical protein [Pirellulaceae bacterium]
MSNDPFSQPGFDKGAANPYAPTTNISAEPIATDDVEAYRRKYLNHEASVKSIGVLYLLGAIFMVPAGLFITVAAFVDPPQGDAPGAIFMALLGLLYLGLGVLQGSAGIGLRKLKPWARVVGIIFSVIGLLAIPLGTIIAAYFLYLLLSQKGQIVFSDQYKEVIAQTPHIKYKTSIIVWIFLVLLVLLIALGVAGALLG